MKNEIGIVICNYNGGKDTVQCIKAIHNSNFKNYDIIVVDNASEDDSVELLKAAFGDEILLLQNKENLGGSGGFGSGMRYAVQQGYKYVAAVDNDAFVNEDTLTILYNYLVSHEGVGIVGAKVLDYIESDIVTEYAPVLNTKTYCSESAWKGKKDGEVPDDPMECDFVATTTAMITHEALTAADGMDEACFIYYDDIELSCRICEAGFRVVSIGSAKVWHKSGLKRATSTFGRYYYTRNRYRFFARYIAESQLDDFAEYVLRECFTFMYGSHYKGRLDFFETTKYILEDFIADKRGRAGEYRIWPLDPVINKKLCERLRGVEKIHLQFEAGISKYHKDKYAKLLNKLQPKADIAIIDAEVGYVKEAQLTSMNIYLCNHVKDLQEYKEQILYMDIHDNIVGSMEDYIYFKNFENSYSFFRHIYWNKMIEGIRSIRGKRR